MVGVTGSIPVVPTINSLFFLWFLERPHPDHLQILARQQQTAACGTSVIRSEIRSRAELNCALPLFLHPSHQRDTAHRPIGTGRLHLRRRFGYWGEQIGRLRDHPTSRQIGKLIIGIGASHLRGSFGRPSVVQKEKLAAKPDPN
jgi:hypothetical protein